MGLPGQNSGTPWKSHLHFTLVSAFVARLRPDLSYFRFVSDLKNARIAVKKIDGRFLLVCFDHAATFIANANDRIM